MSQKSKSEIKCDLIYNKNSKIKLDRTQSCILLDRTKVLFSNYKHQIKGEI